MQEIPSLVPADRADLISNLQDALRALMPPRREIIAPQDPKKPTRADLEKWAEMIRLENGNYGAHTTKAVDTFQRQQGINAGRWGAIDGVTAAALNAKLREAGELDPGPPAPPTP